MTHVELQSEAPPDTAFMFANPSGGWDCYSNIEDIPPEQRRLVEPQDAD